MPDLAQSLEGRDLGHLRILAELWGIDFSAPDARVGVQRIVPALLVKSLVRDMVEKLPADARAALDDLLLNDGRLPWPLFTRRYGQVREMGPGRRDRERPYANPASPAEALWYRGLIARAFLDTPSGPEEFAYVPDDLQVLAPVPPRTASASLGRPASPAERHHSLPATHSILDHATTLLAALRLNLPLSALPTFNLQPSTFNSPPLPLSPSLPPEPLKLFLHSASLLSPSSLPLPDPTRLFLEMSRGEALALLTRAWLDSDLFNELRLLPGLSCEGDWQNDPRRARRAVLDFLQPIAAAARPSGSKEGRFWSLPAFVQAVRQFHPDFQRPAGDYDSWFIRDENTGEFLRGFEHWDAIDGALIRYILTGPLHWLGIVDLALPSIGGSTASGSSTASGHPQPTAFRFTPWAASLLSGAAPSGLPAETETVIVRSDGRLRVPSLAPRAARYQLARFGLWEGEQDGAYLYHLTPASLDRARQQGLRLSHLLAVLRRHAPSVPPTLYRALERWEERGVEARLEQAVILRVSRPDLLQALRSSRAARFLGDPLGPTAVIVKPGAWQKVMDVLTEMGYLGEVTIPQDEK